MIKKKLSGLLLLWLILAGWTLSGCGSSGTDHDDTAAHNMCPAGSLLDEAEDYCYIECDDLSNEQCDKLEKEIFGDFDEYVVDSYSGVNQDEDSIPVAQYSVNSDLTLSELENTEPEKDELFREIWANTSELLPRAIVVDALSEFHIDSDGESDTLAYVSQDENSPGRWIMAFDDIDYTGPTDKEFIHTSIHEFGHIVFLGKDQLTVNELSNCTTYQISEGCSRQSSYINTFYDLFWIDLIDEHSAIETDDDLLDFHQRYQSRFVSEYAATNPIEDAAEVFTHFVLGKKPLAGNSIIDRKILLMYEIEALRKIRKDIRGKLTLIQARQKRLNQ